jgi:hypothetical protein
MLNDLIALVEFEIRRLDCAFLRAAGRECSGYRVGLAAPDHAVAGPTMTC